MEMETLIGVVALALIYFAFLYTSLKNTGGLKDERGRRINQVAAEKILIVLQALLLVSLIGVELNVIAPKLVLVITYIVAIVGHVLLRYYYSRVM